MLSLSSPSSGIAPRKRTFVRLGLTAAAATVEDGIVLATLRTHVATHVLDDPEDRRLHRVEHADAATHILQSDVLRRRHDHAAGDRDLLQERQLRVARSRWQVDDEDVELAPNDVPEKLSHDAHDHGPAPDHG